MIEARELGGHTPWAAETDKSWDAMHRCFNGGTFEFGRGEYPFDHIILEREQLVTSGEYYITLNTPEQVRDIAARIGEITQDVLTRRDRLINPRNYGMPLSEEDRPYTWERFKEIAEFYQRAAKAGRRVIFTVDLLLFQRGGGFEPDSGAGGSSCSKSDFHSAAFWSWPTWGSAASHFS